MDVVEGIVWNQIGNRFDNSGASDLFYEKKWEWKYLRVRILFRSESSAFYHWQAGRSSVLIVILYCVFVILVSPSRKLASTCIWRICSNST